MIRIARYVYALGLATTLLAFSSASLASVDCKLLVMRVCACLVAIFLFWPNRISRCWVLPAPRLLLCSGAFIALSAWATYRGPYGNWMVWGDGVVILVLFLECGLLFPTAKEQKILWWAWFSACIPICLYSWIQVAGLDPLFWENAKYNPVGSTLGNRNFLAYFLLTTIPMAFYQFRHGEGALRIVAAGACFGSGVTLLIGDSRAAWGVLLLYILLAVWVRKRGLFIRVIGPISKVEVRKMIKRP